MNETLQALLGTQTEQRLLRLFAVGCCRQIWDLLKDEKSRIAVEVSERFADGKATRKELKKALAEVHTTAQTIAQWEAYYAASAATYYATYAAASAAVNYVSHNAVNNVANAAASAAASAATYNAANYAANYAAYAAANAAARQKQLDLYNCLFTKIVFSTTNRNAINLAKLIYLERNWTLMPILGDALEEEGVSKEAVSHCKEKEHARGCWVIDNLLGHRK